jgi:hypothetical protein
MPRGYFPLTREIQQGQGSAETAAAQGLIDTPAIKTEIVLEQRKEQPQTAS